MMKPDPTQLLQADHLEALETHALAEGQGVEGQATFAPALTLADAVETLRRIRYHQGAIADVQAQADALIAPLQAEIDQLRAWARDQIEDRLRRINVHEARLVAYYQANPPARGKTLKLPGGQVACRSQQPEWMYENADALLQILRADGHPAVRTKYEIDRAKLKAMTEVLDDGQVMDKHTGLVLPGVTVFARPDKFVVEVEP